MKIKETIWLDHQKLILTQLSGDLDSQDIEEWQQSLLNVLDKLEDNTRFKFMVNLHGFKAVNFEAHKKFRVIIPLTLANYGWYVGYLRMFPETEITIKSSRNIHCIAAVHVHHDETKISNYDNNYRMHNERFFTDPQLAREWIDSILIPIV